MTYIFLDTCAIVDCAYSRNAKANPSLLDKVLDLCSHNGVRLLLSEVVLGELKKVAKETRESTVNALRNLESQVDEIAESGVLGIGNVRTLQEAIRKVKGDIVDDADSAIKKNVTLRRIRLVQR